MQLSISKSSCVLTSIFKGQPNIPPTFQPFANQLDQLVMPLVIPDHCTLLPSFLSVIPSQQMPQPTIIVNLGGRQWFQWMDFSSLLCLDPMTPKWTLIYSSRPSWIRKYRLASGSSACPCSVARQVPFPMLYAGWSETSSWGKSLREMEMTLVCIFLTSFYLFFVMIYIKFTTYREAGN